MSFSSYAQQQQQPQATATLQYSSNPSAVQVQSASPVPTSAEYSFYPNQLAANAAASAYATRYNIREYSLKAIWKLYDIVIRVREKVGMEW